MAENAIIITNLSKNYGKIKALDNVSMEIKKGETYGLLGPNGAGKTTLIKILVGLAQKTSGTCEILGEKTHTRNLAKRIGYMPQVYSLYMDLTIVENLEFFGTIYGIHDKKLLKERIEYFLDFVDLRDRKDDVAGNLSGGMKQRVSLACAIIHKPEILLLDEPTVGIDPYQRRILWNHFYSLNKEGVTIIVSSHIMDEAERCPRIGLIRNGKLIAEGSSSEIKKQAGVENLEDAFLYFAEKKI